MESKRHLFWHFWHHSHKRYQCLRHSTYDDTTSNITKSGCAHWSVVRWRKEEKELSTKSRIFAEDAIIRCEKAHSGSHRSDREGSDTTCNIRRVSVLSKPFAFAMTEVKYAPAPKAYTTRVLLVCFAMFQITLAAGLIIGWPGIAGSMLVMPLEKGGAGLTLDQTTQLYGLAAAVNYVAPLFLGLVLDNWGPRVCSALSNVIVAVGLAIFSSASSFGSFALGISCVAFGGPSVQQSLLHIGNMFAERRYFVMGVVAESITLSFGVFPIMDIIWDRGYGFRILFGSLGAMVFASSIGSLLLWPDAPYEIPTSGDTKEEKAETEDPNKQLKEASFLDQLSSGVYLRLCIFFIVTSW